MDDATATSRPWTAPPAVVLLALCVLFVVIDLPALADLAKYHGDERFYTDAAIRMVETGDYATPRYPDGEPRFNKPLLTYWAVAASFRLFGVGVVASRLPFVAAGCLLAAVTFWLGRRLLEDRAGALVAAAIVLANSQLAVLATRATPDILLVLFVALSFAGFASLLGGDRRRGAYAAAWIGAGLAVATKGAPGLVAVAYCLAFVAISAEAPRVRALFDLPSVVLGVAVAASGFATPYLRHGRQALDVLYVDQIGARPVVTSFGALLANVGSYLLGTAVDLLPWTLLLAVVVARDRDVLRRAVSRRRSLYVFGVGWWLALVALFATHDFMRPRYLAPAYPILSVLLVAVLSEALRRREVARTLRAVADVLLVALAVAGAALAVTGAAVDRRLVVAGLLWVGTGLAGVRLGRASTGAPLVAVAVATMIAIAGADSLVRPVFDASPARALAACLRARGSPATRAATVGVSPNLASKIRLVSSGTLDLATLPDDVDRPTLKRYGVLVVPPARAAAWRDRGYTLEPCGYEYVHWAVRDLWRLVTRRDRADAFERHRRYYFVAASSARRADRKS